MARGDRADGSVLVAYPCRRRGTTGLGATGSRGKGGVGRAVAVGVDVGDHVQDGGAGDGLDVQLDDGGHIGVPHLEHRAEKSTINRVWYERQSIEGVWDDDAVGGR